MDGEIQKLKDYLDKKFAATASKEDIDNLIVRTVTLEEFTDFKKEVKNDMALIRESIQALTLSVDKLVKIISDRETEYAVMSHQLSRHDKWIQQLAEKLNLKLEY